MIVIITNHKVKIEQKVLSIFKKNNTNILTTTYTTTIIRQRFKFYAHKFGGSPLAIYFRTRARYSGP